ncbi:TauD/TfdA family dioxygenase [Candidimonas humi]|uniref:TauD/TfdA dioxygenase family protein n=1 Tax=Candidimonas humi TaxID=683355 RepID=A0ABV8P600_9BURK|nr:TauD/TfdA family dioxygenase [Candidimonas humi]MBV6307213.1 TauD/TfdA family dioxygenase [Candidimonas humi]
MPANTQPSSVATIKIERINGNIGAILHNVELSRPQSEAEFAVIHQALMDHGVIVMRNQKITLQQQMDFARRFGELSIHPFSPNLDDKREVIVLDYSADNPPALTDQWHADETFRKNPPMGTILRAKVVPEYGGDTLFSSMAAAYTGLSERMKRYIHSLEALHDFKPWRPLFTTSEKHQQKLRELEREYPNPWHPVVRVHPVTKRRILNVNAQFTVKLRDLKTDESDMILNYLYSRAAIPEYQLRVKWEPDTVVMWDNRTVQHYAPHDYYPQRRTMERITVAGDDVVGVSGPYTPETTAPLPNGEQALQNSMRPRPIREFER